jgi:peptidylprolyl isomerase
VIQGWDDGVALMNKGEKATFYIPSHLAYGERGAGGGKIAPNSILIFDIELVSFQ